MINDCILNYIKSQRILSPLKRYYPEDVDQVCYIIYFMVVNKEITVKEIPGEIRRNLIKYGFKECQSDHDRKITGHSGFTIYPVIPSKSIKVNECTECNDIGSNTFNGKSVCQRCYWRLRKREQRRVK